MVDDDVGRVWALTGCHEWTTADERKKVNTAKHNVIIGHGYHNREQRRDLCPSRSAPESIQRWNVVSVCRRAVFVGVDTVQCFLPRAVMLLSVTKICREMGIKVSRTQCAAAFSAEFLLYCHIRMHEPLPHSDVDIYLVLGITRLEQIWNNHSFSFTAVPIFALVLSL